MTSWKKAILNSSLALLTLVLVALLWQKTLILIPLLILVGLVMYKISPSSESIVAYFVTMLFGPLAESIAIYAGVWTYTTPVLLGFPLWLPFVWANTGLFIKNTIDLSGLLIKKQRT